MFTNLSSSYNKNISILYTQPFQEIPEKPTKEISDSGDVNESLEWKSPFWYKQNIRYGASFYNQQLNRFDDANEPIRRSAEQAFMLFSYMMGRQRNVNYNWITQDYFGNSLQGVWQKGNKISSLINYMKADAIDMLEAFEPSVVALSKDVTNRKSDLYTKLKIKYDLKDILGASTGIEFQPMPGQEFESPEDIDKFMLEKWQDPIEKDMVQIANAQYWSNGMKQKYLQCWLHAVVAGYTSVHNYVQNGCVKKEVIPSWQMIWDNRKDSDHNEYAQVWGFMPTMTDMEIFSRWGDKLTKEEREEITSMAKQGTGWEGFMDYYNTGCPNFKWLNYTQKNQMQVSVAIIYWNGRTDLGYRNSENIYGDKTLVETKPDKKGDYWMDDLYYGVLIGNKWMPEWGKWDNVMRGIENKGKIVSPITTWIPGMTLGEGISPTSRIVANQQLLDYYSWLIQNMAAKAIGKVYLINGNKINATNSQEIVQELKTMGVAVVNPVSGESGDKEDARKMIEQMDMTLDANIMRYVELKNEQSVLMQEALGISSVMLGQQNDTIGKGVQQQTIYQGSKAIKYFYTGFADFMAADMQLSLNMEKNLIATGKAYDPDSVIGERGRYMLNSVPGLFEDLLLFIRPNDNLDKESKERIIAVAQADAQNQRISTLDYVKHIEGAKTKTELVNGLEYAQMKQEKKAMQMQAMQQQQQTESAGMLEAQKQEFIAEMEQAKLLHKDWQVKYTADMSAMSKLHTDLEKTNTALMGLVTQLASNPPVTPFEQDIEVNNAAKEQQAQQVVAQ